MKVSFSMLFSKSISVSGRLVHAASVFYLLLPAVLFAFGWLRAIWLLPVLAVLALCGFTLVRSYWQEGGSVKLSVWYMLLCAAAVLVWLAFSGIGGFSYQNLDYYVRNPILNDLTHFSWPLRYDLSAQPDAVQALCGSDPVGFVYYFVFWLPAAALGKVFGAAQLWLFVWCFAGLMLVLLQLQLYLQKQSLLIPVVFMGFSGLDCIPFFVQEGFVKTGHMEWWAGHFFQYSSNTTLLYWVFNQAIPLWLIVGLLLNLGSRNGGAALCSLSFLYSPFATFGMIPLALCAVKKNGLGRTLHTAANWLTPALMLGVWGSFYLSKPGSLGANGWIFALEGISAVKWYFPFVLLEVGVYLLLLRRQLLCYDYLWICAVELVLIPLYKLTDANDFCMRTSIPALLILCISVIRYLLEHKNKTCLALALCLVIGMATPCAEVLRSVKFTLSGKPDANLVGDSFAAMTLDQYEYAEDLVTTVNNQFFAHDWQDSLFEKYLGK